MTSYDVRMIGSIDYPLLDNSVKRTALVDFETLHTITDSAKV